MDPMLPNKDAASFLTLHIVFKLLIITVYNLAACEVIGLPISSVIVLQNLGFVCSIFRYILVNTDNGQFYFNNNQLDFL